MPYRRLPNTDAARIKALKTAINHGYENDIRSMVIPLPVLEEAKFFIKSFENAHTSYVQSLREQTSGSKKCQELAKRAKLYVSHFIQVLNFCVIRGEIKVESKEFYGLDPDNFLVPDLSTDSAILEWAEKIIKGETDRTAHGGIPLYNPAAAKVKVHYDLFQEAYFSQRIYQNNTLRTLNALSGLREKADQIILEIWNSVESHFQDLEPEQKLEKCRHLGVVYYYRKGEKAKLNDSDRYSLSYIS